MSKKKQSGAERDPYKSTAEYYDLKSDAVDRLVDATPENSPEVSEEEINKYRGKKKKKIPSWLKVMFLKFWFSGAVCFFFFWGLGTYVADMLDMLFIIGFAMGVITDLLTNNILRYFEPEAGAFSKYMMFPQKKFWTLFLNILYAFVILACVVTSYQFVKTLIVTVTEAPEGTVPLGVEPILFGLFYLAFDMLFLFMKNTVIKIFRDADNKVRQNHGGK